MFACNFEVKERSGLLWSETLILSALMRVYGEQFAVFRV